ncbi:MAG: PQQ-binding-like beta-propeller repeat protein, partial [Verrucomicrobiota bacterium]
GDGTLRLFIGSHDNYLYCLDGSDGKLLWRHETTNYIMATPSVVNSGGQQAVTFGGCDGIFHIVPASGEGSPAEIEIGAYIANSSCVKDGIAYVANNGGDILAIDVASRETVWKIETDAEYTASPAVNEKHLFIASPHKTLTAYDRVNGQAVWEFMGRRSFDSSPVVSQSTVWQAGLDGRLYAIDPLSGEERWSYEIGAKIKSSPAISSGTLVICGDDGVMYALKGE